MSKPGFYIIEQTAKESGGSGYQKAGIAFGTATEIASFYRKHELLRPYDDLRLTRSQVLDFSRPPKLTKLLKSIDACVTAKDVVKQCADKKVYWFSLANGYPRYLVSRE